MDKIIQTICAVLAGIAGFLWGGMDGLLYALVSFMILDYITGCLVAIVKKELSSKIGFKGIAKKVLIMALVAVGHILDTHILGGGAFCRSAVIGFYIANEGISILENAGELGIPLPKKLIAVLKQMSNYHFTCIAEKSFYVLNSSGTWVSSSEDSTSTLSTTSLNRPVSLTSNKPVTLSNKPVTLSPDVSESNTSDSEGIADDVKESGGTGEIMEETPETETLESNEVTEDAEPLRNTESE